MKDKGKKERKGGKIEESIEYWFHRFTVFDNEFLPGTKSLLKKFFKLLDL